VHRALYLRSDDVTDGKCRDQLLSIAQKTHEEYYVAPPGKNIVQPDGRNSTWASVVGKKKRNKLTFKNVFKKLKSVKLSFCELGHKP